MIQMKHMKKLLHIAIFLLNLNSFGQELFEYEFDENITIDVLADAEEGEVPNGKFIRGTYESEVIVYSKFDIIKEASNISDENGMIRFFKGMKKGILNSTGGRFISETSSLIENVKVFSIEKVKLFYFKIILEVEKQNKIVENYSFIYKDVIYTIQFMNDADTFDDNKEFRKQILESIKFN
jgi:hypothetical protein